MTEMIAAEQNIQKISELVQSAKVHFLEIGRLLNENQENGYWAHTGYDTFRDYTEELGLGSYSWITRLMDLAKVVSAQQLTAADVTEIGVTKSVLLLPAAKQGKLDDETIEIARHCPARDLREHLGHKVLENDGNESIICSLCGNKILGAKWVRKQSEN